MRFLVSAYMVNRYPTAGGQVLKVPLTVMQFARWKKEKKVEFYVVA